MLDIPSSPTPLSVLLMAANAQLGLTPYVHWLLYVVGPEGTRGRGSQGGDRCHQAVGAVQCHRGHSSSRPGECVCVCACVLMCAM